MAFKKVKSSSNRYSDIESLFRDLSTNGIQSLYSHQADVLRAYQDKALDQANVAIELPTGSGKTLIGLLIAEFYRQKGQQRVLYLCPTKQLVNQVCTLANDKYGINACSFTGKKSKYLPKDKYDYKNGKSIAITTYSSLFNTKPWFEEPDLIILDDAHTSENYIASCWSLKIERNVDNDIYSGIVELLKNDIPYTVYQRVDSDDVDVMERNSVDKLTSWDFYDKIKSFYNLLEVYLSDHEDLKYSWFQIKNHLHACQLYFSWNEILIRPMIPPSMEIKPFKKASQRVFMSATLGKGGDLERITGIESFYKIRIPDGWDKQGIGRRFFMFPSISLDNDEIELLISGLIESNKRSVMLTSSTKKAEEVKFLLNKYNKGVKQFSIYDIEDNKDAFLKTDKAAIVMANRFDGIDFSGEESRLLFLVDIPYTSNIQEKFFLSRMEASILFYDRNRTRLIQAIGRCTRSPKDYSAICVIGDRDLSEWLIVKNKYKYFHPELQAEIKFGISQSESATHDDFIDNFNLFLNQGDDWKGANENIIDLRDAAVQEEYPGASTLEITAKNEVKFQYELWNNNYDKCEKLANEIVEGLSGGSELKGFRAFWYYQMAYVAHIKYVLGGNEIFLNKKKDYQIRLEKLIPHLSWTKNIRPNGKEGGGDDSLRWNIKNLELNLANKKVSINNKYKKYLDSLEKCIKNRNLEKLNFEIGLLLGFQCANPETHASPDPYWMSDKNLILVFEDKLCENEEGEIPVDHIRQAASHRIWIKNNVEVASSADIITILVTNRAKVSKEGADIGRSEGIKFWNYSDFVKFARSVINMAQEYPRYYSGQDDPNFRAYYVTEFLSRKFSPKDIIDSLPNLDSLYNK